MSTLKIEIRDNEFQSPNEGNVKKYKKNHLVCNGWECFIKKNNAISCITTQKYDEVAYRLMFKIFKNGEMLWLCQIGKDEECILKKSKLEEWPVNGVIELPTEFDNNDKPYSGKEAVRALLSKSSFTVNL